MFFEICCSNFWALVGSCFLIWILSSFVLAFAFFNFEDPCGAADKGVKTAGVVALIVFALVLSIFYINDCPHTDCAPHADDCQCNECVIDRCEAINHGDTCQCDKCLECKNIGGND